MSIFIERMEDDCIKGKRPVKMRFPVENGVFSYKKFRFSLSSGLLLYDIPTSII
jgi:hypothetical protein